MPSQNTKKKNVSSAAGWKGKKAIVSVLELPSENVCKVRRVSIAKLMAADVFPDELTATINKTVSGGKGSAPTVDNLSNMGVFMEAIDKVAEMVIVEPRVFRPVDEDGNDLADEDRDPDKLYTDDVDLEDKIFVFQYAVGGDSDLTKFRRELGAGVGSVLDGEGVAGQAV